jgi:hypothetical protein
MTSTRLSDIQLLILSTAATRADGSLLPPADSLGELSDRIRKVLGGLIRRGFAEELEVSEPSRVWRTDGARQLGLAITNTGRSVIGVEMPDEPAPPASTQPIGPAASAPTPGTKIGLVLDLMRREQGATLAELVEATHWLPHTTRAELTGLRKKGHVLTRSQRDDVTCYRIAKAA